MTGLHRYRMPPESFECLDTCAGYFVSRVPVAPIAMETCDAIADLPQQRFPVLRDRLLLMHIPGDERATFRDPATAAAVKQQVVAMLREEWRGGS